ncbi:MAG: sigma-70 family RNA polymerase sigma factor [Clostridia bacterium]
MVKKVVICGVNTAELPKISYKESFEMLKQIKSGDNEVRKQFIISNLRLVLSVVQRYTARSNNLDDLFQVGCVGLVKAVDNFNIDLNVKFSTYAVPMIIGEIRRNLRETNSMRVSRGIRDTAYQVMFARELLEQQSSDEIDLNNVSQALDLPIEKITYCLDAINEPISLYEPVYSDDKDCLLYVDQIADKSGNDDVWIDNVTLSQAIKKLGEREQNILRLRYYEGKTQCEVSKEVGISQAQVSRLEKNAFLELKQYM